MNPKTWWDVEPVEMKCEACCYWSKHGPCSTTGTCRRRAPANVSRALWPETNEWDWCGEFESKEAA